MARNVSHGLTEVLELMAEYTGEDSEEIDYQLSTDYLPYAMDSQTLIALIGAVSAGKMSDEEFFEALVAGEMVRPDKTYNQHKEELARMPKPASITPDSGGTFGLADKGIADARAPNTKVAGTAVIDGQAQQSVDKGTK
jgi:acyl carrier protein